MFLNLSVAAAGIGGGLSEFLYLFVCLPPERVKAMSRQVVYEALCSDLEYLT